MTTTNATRGTSSQASMSALRKAFSLGILATCFSIAGLVLAGQPELVDRVVSSVAQTAPGLLKVDGREGLADPKGLLNPTGLGITAIIAAIVTVLTSLGWITSLRDGLRGVVGLPPLKVNPIVQRLRDVGTLVLLGIALVLTSVVSIVFTAALGFVAGLVRLDTRTVEPIADTSPITITAMVSFRRPARNASRSPAPRFSDSSGTSVAWIAWKK